MGSKEPKLTGRPTTYKKDFHPQDFLRQSKSGRQVIQIATSWDLHRDTLYEWAKVHKDFSDAFKRGRQFCESFWMDLGMSAMTGSAKMNGEKVKIDLGYFCYLTKATLGWRDTTNTLIGEEVSSVEIKVTKYTGENNKP